MNDSIYNSFIKSVKTKIKSVYKKYDYDWLVGFSGGKDSSVLCQIIMESLLELNPNFYKNKVYVVSSDTLIENPIVLKQLNTSLKLIEDYAKDFKLPVVVKKVTPNIEESFWVNLIGRGYPLPNQSFRWCTDRLKIKPMENYLVEIKKQSKKEVLTVLGVRNGESKSRDVKLKKSKIEGSDLRVNNSNGKFIFSPIEDFTLYDIWKYLDISSLDFFKENNKRLSILYEESSTGTSECPSSLDDRLQKGCGSSRWGCWLCPVVKTDKSLEGFVNSGYSYLKPLLDFRNELMNERDMLENRFNGSFRINKVTGKVTLVKYRYIDLKNVNGIYELPKKHGRKKITFGHLSDDKKYLINDNQYFEIFSETEYRERVDNNKFNPYSEKKDKHCEFIIKLDKYKNNDKLSTVGFGPYTLSYRKKILKKIIKIRETYSTENNRIEIISDEEISLIKDLINKISQALKDNKEKVQIFKKEIKNGATKRNSPIKHRVFKLF